MIVITDKAIDEIKRVMAEQNLTEEVLRVSAYGGGCSGVQYGLNFCKKEEVDSLNDNLCEANGLSYVVNRNVEQILNGTIIDFYESIEKRGFIFENPNVKKAGCGSGCGSGGCGN